MKLNKELYENIMYNVSIQLKNVLNEAAQNDKETLAYNNLMDFFNFMIKMNKKSGYKMTFYPYNVLRDTNFSTSKRLKDIDFPIYQDYIDTIFANNKPLDELVEFTPSNVKYDDEYCEDYTWLCIKCDIADQIDGAQSGNEDWSEFRIPVKAFADDYDNIKNLFIECTAIEYEPYNC